MIRSRKSLFDTTMYNVDWRTWQDCIGLATMCTVPDGKVCLNGGTNSCTCANGVAICICYNGYTGESCEIPPGKASVSYFKNINNIDRTVTT